jgi:PAS domain S-box-containing protein
MAESLTQTLAERRAAPRPSPARYAAALLAVGAAVALTALVREAVGDRIPFAFFYAAVIVTTYYGGLRAGLVAFAASALLANYFFLSPFGAFSLSGVALLQTSVFAFTALCVVFFIDRSQRARAALAESEGRLLMEQRAARVGTWEWDLRTDAVTWSEGIWELLGGASEGRRPGIGDWAEFMHPEDRGRAFAKARAVIASGGAEYYDEFRVRRTDGNERWLASKAVVVRDAEGRAERLVGVNFDITERRRAEEARAFLAALVESSDDAIVGKTLEGVVTSWNEAAERLYGYAAGEMVGRSLSVIFPADRAGELAQLLARLRDGERIENHETTRVTKDGRLVEVSLTVSPVRDADGRIIGASTIARDIGWRRPSGSAPSASCASRPRSSRRSTAPAN